MLNKEELQVLTAEAEAVVGADSVRTGDSIGADFCHDEYPGSNYCPDIVIDVESTDQVASIMALCSTKGISVTTRGAGTGQVGGSVPVKGGVVLSMKNMNKILGCNEADSTITVQAGVLLQEVKDQAAAMGKYYPPDPGEKTATIGGNVSTNAAGPCAGKYGRTADYVKDAVIVLANGEVVRLSDKPEYRSIIGAEGTLAVITEITLKLIDKPAADVSLLFPFMDTETAVSAALKIKDAGFAPAILEYMDTDVVEFSGNVTGEPFFPVDMDGERPAATLMVTLEADNDDALDEAMESIAELSEELEPLDILVIDTPTMKRDAWTAHDAFHTSMETAKATVELNVDVPADSYAETVEYAKAAAASNGLTALIYGHIDCGGMHIHAVADMDKDEFDAHAAVFKDAVYKKVSDIGGCIAGEYGIGYAKIPYVSLEKAEAHKAIKAAMDPKGILNPGKIIGERVESTIVAESSAVVTAEKAKEIDDNSSKVSKVEAAAQPASGKSLKILCCIKQVPDVDQMRMDPETGNLVRAGVPAILNPQDANALAAAVSVQKTYGGEITLITMGPPNAEAALRECLAAGAQKAILVTDRAFGNADTLATSYSILSAANTQDHYDLIFCGKESLDGATGQMGAQLAERFGAAQVTSTLLIKNINAENGTIVVDRRLDDGVETLEVKMPVLMTMEKSNYPAIIPSLKGKMAAKKVEITVITANDIPDLDRNRIGDAGSPTKVPRMFPPVMPEPGMILNEGSIEANVAKLISLIKN